MNRDAPLLRLRAVRKTYHGGRPNEVEVLHGIDLALARGEFAALIGPSGSGKSTLLNILGLLERASDGDYDLAGQSVRRARRRRADRDAPAHAGLRVPVPPPAAGLHRAGERDAAGAGARRPRRHSRARARRARCSTASAWARRCSASRPSCPAACSSAWPSPARWRCSPRWCWPTSPPATSTPHSSDEVFALLRRIHAQAGTSFLVVTHDPRLAARCDRVIELVDGRIARDEPVASSSGGGA